MPTTTRAALRYPLLADTPDVPRDIGNLAADADSVFAMYGQGTFASRPTSTGGTPGKSGRFYYATDTVRLYYDFGTGWTEIGPTSGTIGDRTITGTKLVLDTVTSAEIAAGAVGTAEHADDSVTFVKINAAMKPSQGAAASAEALRALGTGSGLAAAGTHASQHSRTGADPLVISTFISSGTFASRPSTNLVAGMIYTATDQSGGTTYMYTGSAWIQMGGAVTGGGVSAHASTHVQGSTDPLAANSVVNATISPGAAIAFSKLESLPPRIATAHGAVQHVLRAGTVSGTTTAGSTRVNFPVAFSNATVYVVLTNWAPQAIQLTAVDASGFNFSWSGMGTGDGFTITYFALGLL